MGKKVQALLTVTLLLALLFSATAYAAPENMGLCMNISATNTYISTNIDRAVALADQALNTCKSRINAEISLYQRGLQTEEKTLADIATIEAAYKAQLDQIASTLIKTTDRRAFNLIVMGDRYNVEIISEYVEVQLGNQVYLVDPLRIVGN